MKYLKTFSLLLIGAIVSVALSAAAAGTWTPAPTNPPSGNAEAPLNVGDFGQAKTGLLALKNFLFNPTGVAGSITPGAVLTAVDDDGTVGWATPGTASAEEIFIQDECVWTPWFRRETTDPTTSPSPQYAPEGYYVAGIDYQAQTGGDDGKMRFYYCRGGGE